MIASFKHKGLERFFLTGSLTGFLPKHADKLRLILARLHASACPQDMNLPRLHLHALVGDRQGTWAVKVNSNWRVTFNFTWKDAHNVNYEDYY